MSLWANISEQMFLGNCRMGKCRIITLKMYQVFKQSWRICLQAKEAYLKMDMEKSYRALFELLWYSQLPCYDVMDVTSTKKNEFGEYFSVPWVA
jgi:hypothetical protein